MLKKQNAMSLSAEEDEGDVCGGGEEGDGDETNSDIQAAAATQHATAIVVYTRRESSFVVAAGHAHTHDTYTYLCSSKLLVCECVWVYYENCCLKNANAVSG